MVLSLEINSQTCLSYLDSKRVSSLPRLSARSQDVTLYCHPHPRAHLAAFAAVAVALGSLLRDRPPGAVAAAIRAGAVPLLVKMFNARPPTCAATSAAATVLQMLAAGDVDMQNEIASQVGEGGMGSWELFFGCSRAKDGGGGRGLISNAVQGRVLYAATLMLSGVLFFSMAVVD